jgi:hypothetical protein
MQAIGYFAVACDRLFEDAIHQQCGGPAEDALLQSHDVAADLIDRFDASPRTVVSLYRPRS